MANGLAISAYYYPQYDGVEVVWSAQMDGEIVAPLNIVSAQAKLYKGPGNSVLLQSTDVLNKFHANADFTFRAIFLHPASTQGLEIEASIIDNSGNVWRKRVVVAMGLVTVADAEFGSNIVNNVPA